MMIGRENDHKETGGVNIIAYGTQVQGNIVTTGDCRIDGAVRGNVSSKSKIIVGQSGMIEGNIICQNIEIEGSVKAETLNVAELVALRATANLTGNISTGKIAIEPGAEFSGYCRMHDHAGEPVDLENGGEQK